MLELMRDSLILILVGSIKSLSYWGKIKLLNLSKTLINRYNGLVTISEHLHSLNGSPVLHSIISLNDIRDTLIFPPKSFVISYVCGIKTEEQQHSQTELT